MLSAYTTNHTCTLIITSPFFSLYHPKFCFFFVTILVVVAYVPFICFSSFFDWHFITFVKFLKINCRNISDEDGIEEDVIGVLILTFCIIYLKVCITYSSSAFSRFSLVVYKNLSIMSSINGHLIGCVPTNQWGNMEVKIVFLAVFLFVASILLVVSSEPSGDKKALLDFARKLSHSHPLNWDVKSSACRNWTGVTCNHDKSRIIALRLPGVGFSGQIPFNTLSRLSALQLLSLRSNSIYNWSFPFWFS